MNNNENTTFEDICFRFQNKIVKIWNDEEQIPFLLKYYLIKDIWNKIEENKFNIDMQVRSKLEAAQKYTLDLQTGETIVEEINEIDQ